MKNTASLDQKIQEALGRKNKLNFPQLMTAMLDYFDVSQTTLNDALGRPHHYISNIKGGRTPATLNDATSICTALATLIPGQPQIANINEFCTLAKACHKLIQERNEQYGNAQYALRLLPRLEGGRAISMQDITDGTGILLQAIHKFEAQKQKPSSEQVVAIIEYLEAQTKPLKFSMANDVPPGAAYERAFYARAAAIYKGYEGSITPPHIKEPDPEDIMFGKRLRAIREELDSLELHQEQNPGSLKSFAISCGYQPNSIVAYSLIEEGKMRIPDEKCVKLYAHLGIADDEAFEALGDAALRVQAFRDTHFGAAIEKLASDRSGGVITQQAQAFGVNSSCLFASYYNNCSTRRSPSFVRKVAGLFSGSGISGETQVYQHSQLADIPIAEFAAVEAFIRRFNHSHAAPSEFAAAENHAGKQHLLPAAIHPTARVSPRSSSFAQHTADNERPAPGDMPTAQRWVR